MSGYVTGAAIIGMKYDGGVLLAADTKISYGRLAKLHNYERLQQISKNCVFCSTGDVADHQYVTKLLKKTFDRELVSCNNDELHVNMDAEMLHNYLSRVLYARRSKLDPILLSSIIIGYKDDKSYLGYSDHYGTKYTDDFITTGFGKYFAIGPLREEHRNNMSKDEATNLAIKCMKLLYLRDCSAHDKIQIAYINNDGVNITQPFTFETKWDFQKYTLPTSSLPIESCQF